MGVKDIATPVTLTPSFPGWEDPPLPGGPPTTPGGDRTVQSGAGLRTAALVGPGHRIPILYGRCLVTPDIVRVSMSGYRAEFLAIISEGPIDAVETWLTDGSRIDEIVVTLGTMSTPSWRLPGTIGLAAAYIRTAAGSPYQPKLIGRGRTPFDPRLGAWGAGSYPDPTKCAYSKNPALLMADLKTFPQYGSGRPTVTPDRVDWQSVENAADWCDGLVGGSKRYEVSLYIQLGQDAKVWEDTIGLHAGLRWREGGGLWHLDYSAPVATPSDPITTDHLVEDSTPRLLTAGGAGLADRPNVFTAEWTDPTDWSIKTVTIRHPAVEAGLEAERPAATYKLHGFQTATMAERALWRIAKEIWSEQTLELELTTERLDLAEGSRVPVILPGIGLSGAEFLVTKTSYDADIVRVTARRYDPDTWSPPGTAGSSGATGPGFFDVPDEVVNAALTIVESQTTFVTPLEKRYYGYAGISWEAPTFPWVRQLRVKVANAVVLRPVAALSVTTGGSGHTVGQAISFVTSTGTGATAHVSAVDGGGAVTAAIVDTPGSGYDLFDYAKVGSGPTAAEFTISGFGLPDVDDPAWVEERPVPLLGDAGTYVDPVAKASLRPFLDYSTITTYSAGGAALEIAGTNHPLSVLIRVESLAGQISAGVCLVSGAGMTLTTSSPSTDSVKRSLSETPSDGEVAVWDATLQGVRFDAPGGKVLRAQEFTSGSTNWTAPAGVTEVWVTGCAGGGGGGGRWTNAAAGASGGGGGGASVYRKRLAVTPGNTYSVTIGAGGNRGTKSVTAASVTNGSAGGATSFGALLSLTGGTGGGKASDGNGGTGGDPGGAGGERGSDGWIYSSTYSAQPLPGRGGASFPGAFGRGGDGSGAVGGWENGKSGYLLVEWNQ